MSKLPEIKDLRLFCAVVRSQNFAKAARDLDVSTSFVSKRIGLLEQSLGAKLFHRTSRQMTLSEDGDAIHLWAQRILDDVGSMQDAVTSLRTDPRGSLRISTSFRLGRTLITPALSEFSRLYPRLQTSLIVVDRPIDQVGEAIHLDIRIGEIPEPHLIAHRLAESDRILCASPSYLRRMGTPENLDDLRKHSCLVFRERDQPFGQWRLRNSDQIQTIKVSGPLSSNNNDAIWSWALDGHGIMRASAWDAAPDLTTGALTRVLPEWDWAADMWAVTTRRLSQSAKVRVCVQFLRSWLKQGPQQARGLSLPEAPI